MKPRIAITADLDGTLAEGMHPNFLLDKMGMDRKEFWDRIYEEQKKITNSPENFIALYFTRIIDAVNHYNEQNPKTPITRETMGELGKELDKTLFPGADTLFPELRSDYPEAEFSFRVISCGIKPIIEGSLLERYCDHVCAYDFVKSHYSDRIAGLGLTVSSDEKENVLIRLSIGQSKIRGAYDWPLENSLVLGDGLTDKAMLKVNKRYGGMSVGVISNESDRRNAETELGPFVHSVQFADYRRGSDLRKTIDGFVRSRL